MPTGGDGGMKQYPLGKLVYKNEIKSKIGEPLAIPPQKKNMYKYKLFQKTLTPQVKISSSPSPGF
jgi:hypothetical protein